jgi:EAL domain-containing protein (putative c-di-GMP-specific phosphodiesterase class I)
VQTIAGLARNVGIMTTAEGVETQQQLEQVSFRVAPKCQGFLFSLPRRVEEIAPFTRAGQASAISHRRPIASA